MSSSSPDDDPDCVVAVKFLGPQISFCRPADHQSSNHVPEWTNIIIKEPSFQSSRVMFSKRDQTFYLLGSKGNLITSLDLLNNYRVKVQPLHFENLDKRKDDFRGGLDLCNTSEYLVESESTGEMFIVKSYMKAPPSIEDEDEDEDEDDLRVRLKTIAVSVFKLDIEQGKAVYTQDIGDLAIFISTCSESCCVTASSFPDNIISPNLVHILDYHEEVTVTHLSHVKTSSSFRNKAYLIPPQQNNTLHHRLKPIPDSPLTLLMKKWRLKFEERKKQSQEPTTTQDLPLSSNEEKPLWSKTEEEEVLKMEQALDEHEETGTKLCDDLAKVDERG